ncbi:aminoglycoside phosphotransferase family protein [Sinomonas flava]|uniref:aminoglycoside phosphotransferase family protein n=1 Tax=Sinomonas flava TaxID=496857 RepID=UPI0039A6DD76
MTDSTPLNAGQFALLGAWFGAWEVLEDLSWGVQGIHVLRVRTARGTAIVKASETGHHIQREVRAHRRMTAPLASLDPPRASRLLHADTRAGVLATTWLPGRLVEGSAHERSEEAFRQAGQLLSLVHVPGEKTVSYDPAALNKVGDFLARARGLAPAAHLRAVERAAHAHRPEPRRLYATHGDYTPRNWLVDGDPSADGRVSVIDWGRAGYRPWVTDLVRLEHQWFKPDRPGTHDAARLRAAFYAGYGRDPAQEPGSWRLDNILQSLGTIVWAHDVGDAAFEEEGRRMLARVVDWLA